MSRVAIVTGAGRGIGAATVSALAADGWSVLAVDRCEDDPRLPYPLATRAELDEVVAGAATARAFVADVTDEAQVAAAVAAAEEMGELDGIVANAGAIAGGAPAWELSAERQQAVLEVNLGGVIATARAGVPALLRRPQPRRGRFVATASAAAARGMPGLAAYSAAKAGVAGFVRGLAADLRGTGVTANAIAPGSTRTRLLEESASLYELESGEDFAPQHVLERLIEPGEVAALIAWLLGPVSAAVTGALLPVDAGLSL
jgi:SDR family mycofactocin-dependent oxidoreductase